MQSYLLINVEYIQNLYCGLRTLDTKNTSLYHYWYSACFMISGYLATKTKEVIYLKDPQLFDPTRPTRKNPYWEEMGEEFDFEQNHIYFKYNFSTARAIQSVRKYREKWKIILHTILHRYVLGNFRGRSLAVLWSNSGNFSIWLIFCLVFVTLAFYNFVTIII